MALVAMEQPLSFSAEHIRAEKLKVLHACRPLSLDDLGHVVSVRVTPVAANGDDTGFGAVEKQMGKGTRPFLSRQE